MVPVLLLMDALAVISIVIPAFNECESLEVLYTELDATAAASALELDIIFVDDG